MTNTSSKQVEPELKACWCRSGTSALSVRANMDHGDFACRERGRYVFCSNCWTHGPTYTTDKEAVDGWNKFRTRVPVDSVAPRVDQQDNEEIRLALEGMIAAFDVSNYGDASMVATTRECALSIAKRAVGWTFASPAPKEEEARKVAIEILEWLNFDTSLDAVATDIYGVEAIIARHFCAPAPVVSDCDPEG